jgi:hypothetical protein
MRCDALRGDVGIDRWWRRRSEDSVQVPKRGDDSEVNCVRGP